MFFESHCWLASRALLQPSLTNNSVSTTAHTKHGSAIYLKIDRDLGPLFCCTIQTDAVIGLYWKEWRWRELTTYSPAAWLIWYRFSFDITQWRRRSCLLLRQTATAKIDDHSG